jgi:transcriptional regulator with XRE-family HTH domain
MNGNGFLERLRQAAHYKGVRERQTDIAASLGIPIQTVNQWFTKGYMPKRELIIRIARTYGVGLEWLANGEGDMLPKPSENLSSDERDLVKNYRMASPKVREVISTMARAARKSVVTIAAASPPLLAAPQTEAANMLHSLACVLCQIVGLPRRQFKIS